MIEIFQEYYYKDIKTIIENNSIVSNKKCSTTIEIDPIREIRLDEESRVDHKFLWWVVLLPLRNGRHS